MIHCINDQSDLKTESIKSKQLKISKKATAIFERVNIDEPRFTELTLSEQHKAKENKLNESKSVILIDDENKIIENLKGPKEIDTEYSLDSYPLKETNIIDVNLPLTHSPNRETQISQFIHYIRKPPQPLFSTKFHKLTNEF